MNSDPEAPVSVGAVDKSKGSQPAASSLAVEHVEEAKVVEHVLYRVFQTVFLEERLRELARGGGLSGDWAELRSDLRATVVASAMRPCSDGRGDVCFPGPASSGASLAFGATPLEFLRWAGQRGTSPAAARAGGGSWTDLRRGLFGWSGFRGTMTQVLAGAASTFARRREDRAALVFEDRRAVETGAWHEGMSVAAAARAPLVVVLISAIPRLAPGPHPAAGPTGPSGPDLSDVARGYGIATAKLCANDCGELWRAAASARALAVAGHGPVVAELRSSCPVPPGCDRRGLASWASRAGLSDRRFKAVEEAARIDVEQAARRLDMEPGPSSVAALACVASGTEPLPHWTRRDPPDPRSSGPLNGAEHFADGGVRVV